MQLGAVSKVEQPSKSPRPGASWHGYRLLEKLSHEDGHVWRAEAPGGFLVALRFVLPGDRRAEREARALEVMRAIHHPNILAAFAAWRDDETLVIATELTEQTLSERFEEARKAGEPGIPADELLGYLADAAKGIDFLNEHTFLMGEPPGGLQLQDLSPKKLHLLGGGVKIVGIGMAESVGRGQLDPGAGWSFAYVSPELFRGRISRHSDQYSLAVCYCQLRTGELPYSGSLSEIVLGHLAAKPDLTHLPQAERAIVARALSQSPEHRWPSCMAFVEALRAIHGGTQRLTPDEPLLGASCESPTNGLEDVSSEEPMRPDEDTMWMAESVHESWAEFSSSVLDVPSAEDLLEASCPARSFEEDGEGILEGAFRSDEPGPNPHVMLVDDQRPFFGRWLLPGSLVLISLVAVFLGISWTGAERRPSPVTLAPPIPSIAMTTAPAPPPLDIPGESSPSPAQVEGSRVAPRPPSAAPPGVEGGGQADVPTLTEAPPTAEPPGGDPQSVAGEMPSNEGALSPATSGQEGEITALAPSIGATRRPEEPSAPEAIETLEIQTPKSLTLHPGEPATLEVKVQGTGSLEGPVELRVEGLPGGLAASSVTISAGESEAEFSLAVPPDEADREGQLIVRGTAGQAVAEAAVAFTVGSLSLDELNDRGLQHLRAGRVAAALTDFDALLLRSPEDVRARKNRGAIHWQAGRIPEALEDYDVALRVEPRDAAALNNRGLVHRLRGEFALALADYDAALRIDTTNPVLHYNRAQALSQAGQVEEAILALSEAVRLNPSYARAFRARAEARLKNGDRQAGEDDLSTARRLELLIQTPPGSNGNNQQADRQVGEAPLHP